MEKIDWIKSSDVHLKSSMSMWNVDSIQHKGFVFFDIAWRPNLVHILDVSTYFQMPEGTYVNAT